MAGGQSGMWLLPGAARYSVATWWKSPSLTGGIWGQINGPHLFKTDRIGQSHLSAGKSQKSVHCSRSHVTVGSASLFPDRKNNHLKHLCESPHERPLYGARPRPPTSSRIDRSTLVERKERKDPWFEVYCGMCHEEGACELSWAPKFGHINNTSSCVTLGFRSSVILTLISNTWNKGRKKVLVFMLVCKFAAVASYGFHYKYIKAKSSPGIH